MFECGASSCGIIWKFPHPVKSLWMLSELQLSILCFVTGLNNFVSLLFTLVQIHKLKVGSDALRMLQSVLVCLKKSLPCWVWFESVYDPLLLFLSGELEAARKCLFSGSADWTLIHTSVSLLVKYTVYGWCRGVTEPFSDITDCCQPIRQKHFRLILNNWKSHKDFLLECFLN